MLFYAILVINHIFNGVNLKKLTRNTSFCQNLILFFYVMYNDALITKK